MAIRWKSKIFLFKMEEAYGVDSNPTGEANAILLSDVQLQPMEGEEVARAIERPYLGAQETYKVALRSVLSGSIELVGSGETGVAPAWGPLMRACAWAEVVTPDDEPGDGKVEYKRVSDEHESGVGYFWIGNTLHKFVGTRGDATIGINAQGIPVVRFTLTGIWVQPLEAARLVPALGAFMKPTVATHANTPVFTVGGVSLKMRSFSLACGNDVQPRMLVGGEEILIVDISEQIATTVEAVPLTTFNPFARAVGLTPTAVALTHGVTPGRRVSIAVPAGSVERLTGYENQQNVLEWPLRITPQPVTGDDQLTITC